MNPFQISTNTSWMGKTILVVLTTILISGCTAPLSNPLQQSTIETTTEQKTTAQPPVEFTAYNKDLWELTDKNGNYYLRSKHDCFNIMASKLNESIPDLPKYLEKQYNAPLAELLNTSTNYSQVWQGIEAYDLKATGEGEINLIYVLPGEQPAFLISILSTGISLAPGYSCQSETVEVPDILRGIKFL